MRRLHLTRALVSGPAASVAAAAVLYVVGPLFGAEAVDAVGWLAERVARVPAEDRARAGRVGWPLALAAGAAVALLFAALWDAVPPRTRPVSKALVFTGLVFLVVRAPLAAWPAALAFGLVLGLVYRPHPAPPRDPEYWRAAAGWPKSAKPEGR